MSDVSYSNQTRGGKADPLASSMQTVDEDGVIHGVTPEGVAWTLRDEGVTSGDGSKVTLGAVGDQIGTDNSNPIARCYGQASGKDYDFTPVLSGGCAGHSRL